jgi:hypothetical protein
MEEEATVGRLELRSDPTDDGHSTQNTQYSGTKLTDSVRFRPSERIHEKWKTVVGLDHHGGRL